MLGLEAIGNNGYSSSIILKTVESDIDLINKFCKMLLEKGEIYGFKIR